MCIHECVLTPRQAIAVIHYLNDSNVHKKWATIYNLQRKEWERAVQQHPTPIKMIKAFDEINALHRNEMTKKVKKFVNDWGNNLRIHLYGNSQKWAVEARDATVIFDQIMQTLKVKDDGFDGA